MGRGVDAEHLPDLDQLLGLAQRGPHALARVVPRHPGRRRRDPGGLGRPKARAELGYTARPYREGLSDAISWFRETGYLA